jgi:DNA-binding response OmpR family regulator
MKVLIADDESAMRDILKLYFEKEGYDVQIAKDGDEVLEKLSLELFDLLLLDWMMPKTTGLEVLKSFRDFTEAKVIMMTAKTTTEDELAGLLAGADDYVKKPFDPKILLLRANKLVQMGARLKCGSLSLDQVARTVFLQNERIELTAKEYELLLYLMLNPGQILTRQQLLDHVWGYDYSGDERTLDTHIKRLRQKIGEDRVKTYRGMGYCFEMENV